MSMKGGLQKLTIGNFILLLLFELIVELMNMNMKI